MDVVPGRKSVAVLKTWWGKVRSSLWFIPAVMTIGAVALATFTVWLDRHGVASPGTSWFILVAGAEGARGVLSTVAGSIITVTGVVFSITIVVLQLASTQFSPRVLRSFTEDRANQLVLGVFIGTFTYALLVLRTVRSEFGDYSRFVPTLSVNLAVVLAVISMGFLIYFINHIAQSIRAEEIIARVVSDAKEVVERLYPEEFGRPAEAEADLAFMHDPGLPLVAASLSGFLQNIDPHFLMKFAEEHDLVLKIEPRMGAFVVAGDNVISVVSGEVADLPLRQLEEVVVIGPERTRQQDVERGLIELTDIAVRALSPGINDPTTAIVCIHRLTEIFTMLGSRHFPSRVRKSEHGVVRLVVTRPEFPELLEAAYSPVRHHGRGNPKVVAAIEASLHGLLQRLPLQRQPAIHAELARLPQSGATNAGTSHSEQQGG